MCFLNLFNPLICAPNHTYDWTVSHFTLGCTKVKKQTDFQICIWSQPIEGSTELEWVSTSFMSWRRTQKRAFNSKIFKVDDENSKEFLLTFNSSHDKQQNWQSEIKYENLGLCLIHCEVAEFRLISNKRLNEQPKLKAIFFQNRRPNSF